LLLDKKSPLKKYCPEDFKIDLSGKRREWEGTVILPFMNLELMRKCYFKKLGEVSRKDLARNIKGNSFMYTYIKPMYYAENDKNCIQKEKIILS
jgi:5'-3' exoribonuclease 1